MLNMDISIIVTIYNKGQYLSECIKSILNQTKKDIQIVLVNDGSTDNSYDIMQYYAQKYDNITIVNQENQGLAGARISGYKRAVGKYIGWVDADDFIKPNMYETLYELAERNNADLVYCDYEFYPNKIASKSKWFREYNGKRDWHFIDKNTSFCFKLMTKELLDSVNIIGLIEEFGDYAPIVPMLEAKSIHYTKEQLYFYRVGHLSMSGGSFIGKVEHYMKGTIVTKRLKKMIQNKQYEDELNEYFDYRYIYTLLLLLIVAAKNSDKKHYFYAQKELISMDFKSNKYLNIIITENYGALKSFVMTKVMPINYYLAEFISKMAL